MMTGSPPDPFFSGPGLDRADALRADDAAREALKSSPDARELVWRDGVPAVGEDGRLEWKCVAAPDLFLGFDGETACFSQLQEEFADAWAAFGMMAILDASDAPLFAAALSLARWHARHRYCANSGHLSEVARGGWSRRCPECGAEHFPRVDPVVIMIAEHDGRLLLGRQPHYAPGRYSALAGFVEVGENLEAAVARELFEEAGIRVSNVRYIASQPWPFPSSLMIGCHAEAEDSALKIDTAELEDARWFPREEIAAAFEGGPDAPFQPPPKAAIARTLLERWLAA
jgi:NAD+ diphosphatase